MAVRTFISPFDPLVIRETLMREIIAVDRVSMSARVWQTFHIQAFLQSDVPELKVAVAHGRCPRASWKTS